MWTTSSMDVNLPVRFDNLLPVSIAILLATFSKYLALGGLLSINCFDVYKTVRWFTDG